MMVKKKMLTNLFVTSDGPVQILDTPIAVVLGKYWQYLINLLEQNNTTIAPNPSGFQKSGEGEEVNIDYKCR